MYLPVRRQWHLKRVFLVIAALFVFALICSSGYNNYQIDVRINDTPPEEVWNFVSDFNKLRLLNPSIQSFEIITDEPHPHDWRYTVLYTERLGHWPYWQNTIKAYFQVTKSMIGISPESYGILSTHHTCFFKGFYCLKAESQFEFSAIDKDTYCVERIKYQCPLFFGFACRRELESQRKAVMYNLKHIFDKRNHL